jgi:hypothetical protein
MQGGKLHDHVQRKKPVETGGRIILKNNTKKKSVARTDHPNTLRSIAIN